MRYIRTKDGIERAIYGEEFHEGKSYFYKTEYQWVHGDVYHKVKVKTYAKNGITRIADTIEELCDVFVAIGEKGKIITFNEKENLKNYEYTILPIQKLIEKYGAIYIEDKGLIFIAKMNKRGELELL